MPSAEIPELPDYSPAALDTFFRQILDQFEKDAAATASVEELRRRTCVPRHPSSD